MASPAPSPTPTPQSRSGVGAVFLWGSLAGALVVSLHIIPGIISSATAPSHLRLRGHIGVIPGGYARVSPIVSLIVFFVALVIFFLAGLLAARRTGRVATGARAGLWAGAMVCVALALLALLGALGVVALARYGQVAPMPIGAPLARGLGGALIVRALLVTLVVTLVACGAATLGALVGVGDGQAMGATPAASVRYPPYPPAQFTGGPTDPPTLPGAGVSPLS